MQFEYRDEKVKRIICDAKILQRKVGTEIGKTLKEIFAECGIFFQVVKNFQGAPVQGFIKKCNSIIVLSMTIRRAFADEFWFTLFHEIGHLLNNDIKNTNFIDYTESKSDIEYKADEFAKNTLINEEEYKLFIKENILTEKLIKKFAKTQDVEPFIIVGRIQKEKNNFKILSNLKTRYKWE